MKKNRIVTICLFGTSFKYSIIMFLLPIILFSIIGVANDFNMSKYLYGFVVCISSFTYCIMEEYDWRGYLQEEFKFISPWIKYVLIGYLWYLMFLTDFIVANNLFVLGLLIIGS